MYSTFEQDLGMKRALYKFGIIIIIIRWVRIKPAYFQGFKYSLIYKYTR